MSDENKAPVALSAGSPAPDFSLPARSGRTVSLRDFAGQKDVLLYFYPKDDTPGCTRESCSLRDGWTALTNAGIEVLGVSRDDSASHNAFAAKYNLPFELLTDADHSIHEAYGAWGQNPNPAWGVGPLRKSFLIGKDGRIKHVFDKVDTEHHADQVLRAAGVAPAPAPAPKPPAPAPAPAAAPAAPKAAAAPKAPAAPKPAAETKAAAPVKKAAPKKTAPKKAAPKKKAKAKAAPKKKAAKKAKKAKKAAPKRKAAKKAAKKPARKPAKKTKKAAPRRAAKKTAKKKKR